MNLQMMSVIKLGAWWWTTEGHSCLPPSATWTLHADDLDAGRPKAAWLPLQLFAGKPYSICLHSRAMTHIVSRFEQLWTLGS